MPKLLSGLFAVALALLCAAPALAREVVPFPGYYYAPGTIVIRTNERRLYLVLGPDYALRYPVGVGKDGQQWVGLAYIDGMYVRPDWMPPPDMRRDPDAAGVIPGGAPQNPMGEAALTLTGGQYAIHGTNNPASIGRFVSHGCIRMYNEDVTDLFARVGVGTPVVVTR